MEIDIFKARSCKFFIDGYCTRTGNHCIAWAYDNGDRQDSKCDDIVIEEDK